MAGINALPAVEVSANCTSAALSQAQMDALPAVELSKKFVAPKLPLAMLALPAVALWKKFVSASALKMLALPAVALLVNTIALRESPLPSFKKFCVVPELFVMPTPLMVSVNPGLAV